MTQIYLQVKSFYELDLIPIFLSEEFPSGSEILLNLRMAFKQELNSYLKKI